MEAKSIFRTTLTVKVGLNDDLRRFSFTGDFAALRNEVAACFKLDGNFTLKYNDDEGDSITLANDRDLAEARKICGALLKLKVIAKPAPATSTAAPSPSPVVIPERNEEHKKERQEEYREAKEKLKVQWHQEKEQLKALRKEAKAAMHEQKSETKHERKYEKWSKSPKEKLEARFVKDVTFEDGSEVQPGAHFLKTWRFRNEGTRAWPVGSKLIYVSKEKGDKMGAPDEVPAPPAEGGAEVDISVPFVAPQEPGRYVGFWRLITPEGKKFGQRVRVLVYVPASSSESDATPRAAARKGKEAPPTTEQLAVLEQLKAMGFDNQKRNLMLLRKLNGDLTAVVARLVHNQKKRSKTPRKTDDM